MATHLPGGAALAPAASSLGPAWRGPAGALLGLALAWAALALGAAQASDYVVELGFRLALLIVLAEAWNLLAGYGGLVSLGTASFFGVGAYVLVGLCNQAGWPWPAAWALSALAAAGLAALVSRAVFRLRGLYFTVGTLALAEALRLFMVNFAPFGGATGLFLAADPPDSRHLLQWALGLLAATTLLMSGFTASRLGLLLRAVRDDEDAACQMGVRPFRIKLLVFMLASAITGLAGGLQALKLGTVEPYATFGMGWTVAVLSVVIIGGQGRRAGPALGAVFVLALSELLADAPALHLAITGLILIVVIRRAPQGLAGLLERALARRARGGRP
jgi:branched-chain amino acid transport system permease protein